MLRKTLSLFVLVLTTLVLGSCGGGGGGGGGGTTTTPSELMSLTLTATNLESIATLTGRNLAVAYSEPDFSYIRTAAINATSVILPAWDNNASDSSGTDRLKLFRFTAGSWGTGPVATDNLAVRPQLGPIPAQYADEQAGIAFTASGQGVYIEDYTSGSGLGGESPINTSTEVMTELDLVASTSGSRGMLIRNIIDIHFQTQTLSSSWSTEGAATFVAEDAPVGGNDVDVIRSSAAMANDDTALVAWAVRDGDIEANDADREDNAILVRLWTGALQSAVTVKNYGHGDPADANKEPIGFNSGSPTFRSSFTFQPTTTVVLQQNPVQFLVVWAVKDWINDTSTVVCRTYTPSAATPLGPEVVLDTADTLTEGVHLGLTAAANGEGGAVVSWVFDDDYPDFDTVPLADIDSRVEARVLPQGSDPDTVASWKATTILNPTPLGTTSAFIKPAVGPLGEVVVGWVETESGVVFGAPINGTSDARAFRFARWTAEDSWGLPEDLEDNLTGADTGLVPENVSFPMAIEVRFLDNGDVLFVWPRTNSGGGGARLKSSWLTS